MFIDKLYVTMNTEGLYIALIGDIVASREMEPEARSTLQEKLTDLFARLDPDPEKGVASRALLTLGDEFQGLFYSNWLGIRFVLATIPKVIDLVRPWSVRFGVGLGTLSTPLRSEALGMDGSCFHNARRALELTRRTGLTCWLGTPDRSSEATWSALASYAYKQRLDWTAAQAEAIIAYERLHSWTAVARLLNVSKGAVSHRQRAAGWTLYQAAFTGLDLGLGRAVDDAAGLGEPERTLE